MAVVEGAQAQEKISEQLYSPKLSTDNDSKVRLSHRIYILELILGQDTASKTTRQGTEDTRNFLVEPVPAKRIASTTSVAQTSEVCFMSHNNSKMSKHL